MSKKSKAQDREERLRRKLTKARIKFEVAQEEYAGARERGKQEVRSAKLRAAKWQAKASAKLQAAQEALATAEGRLNDILVERGELVSSPAASVEVLEGLEQQAASEAEATGIVLLESGDIAGASELH